MAVITEIEVRYGQTLNTGNYESARIDLMARLKIQPSQDHKEVYESMYKYLRDLAMELAGRRVKID